MRHITTLIVALIAFNSIVGQTIRTPNDTVNQTDKNPYEDFRNIALSLKYQDLELNLSSDKTIVFGVIIDWCLEENIATIIALLTGDASVYLKSGQIYIGGYGHETISEPARNLVINSQALIDKAEKSIDYSYPEKHKVKFYLLTNHGTLIHQETEDAMKDVNNEWTKIFTLGNVIIKEYRLLTK